MITSTEKNKEQKVWTVTAKEAEAANSSDTKKQVLAKYSCIVTKEGKRIRLRSIHGAPYIEIGGKIKNFASKKEAVSHLCSYTKKYSKNFKPHYYSEFETSESFKEFMMSLRVIEIEEVISSEEEMYFHFCRMFAINAK
jgi:hypothetical protein